MHLTEFEKRILKLKNAVKNIMLRDSSKKLKEVQNKLENAKLGGFSSHELSKM